MTLSQVGRITQVRLGRARPCGPAGQQSVIAKAAAFGSRSFGLLGLAGDEQGDTARHGGPEIAIQACPAAQYAVWAAEVPERDAHPGPATLALLATTGAVDADASHDQSGGLTAEAGGDPLAFDIIHHSHSVVLGPDDSCGSGALMAIDIPEGTTLALPATWPGLWILIDSPGWIPVFSTETVEAAALLARIGLFASIGALEGARFDGDTAGLRVNESGHAPLLCLTDGLDPAWGNLSFPGQVNK